MLLRLSKKYIRVILLFFLFFWNASYSFSSSPIIDSLEMALGSTQKDIAKLDVLIDLSVEYLNVEPNKAIVYGDKAHALAVKIGSQKKIALSHCNLGRIYSQLGNYALSLNHYEKSLKLRRELNLESGMFECLNSMGSVYRLKGDYLRATEYSYKALELSEKIGDEENKAIVMGGLAILFDLQGKSDLAIEKFTEALEIFKKIGNKYKVSTTLSNIGTAYLKKEEYDKAIDYYLQSLAIEEVSKNKGLMANGRGNIAVAYHNQGRHKEALKYFNSSLETYLEIGDRRSIALSYNNIGSTHLEQKRYSLAESFFNKSLALAEEIGAKELIRVSYQNLSELYSESRKFEKALSYYQLYVGIKDSIQNKEITSKIATVESNYEIEKKEKKIVLLEKDRIEQEFQLKRRNLIIYLILLSALILSLFFVMFVRNTKVKRASLKEKQSLLREKLTLKERELSSTVTYIANKNNILSETKEDLRDLLDLINESTTRFKLKNVITKIDGNLNAFDDWQTFKRQFDEIYPGYINRLLKSHPNISHNDMKLCVYIKMGISNKEIAYLQNMTLDGVKSANKRLKKKMDLPSEVSLSSFVRKF